MSSAKSVVNVFGHNTGKTGIYTMVGNWEVTLWFQVNFFDENISISIRVALDLYLNDKSLQINAFFRQRFDTG